MAYPLSAFPKRLLILIGVALLFIGILIVHWIADWGLVTIHAANVPLGKVIASIARQGHVRIESSLSPTKLISMDVDKIPVTRAVDILAIRADASWRIVYLAAPSRGDLTAGMTALAETGKIGDWTTHYYPGSPVIGNAAQVIDPRQLSLRIEGSDQNLSKLLDEAAQKSGVMTALPGNWNPVATKLPEANLTSKVIPQLINSAHGKDAEFFFISEQRHPQGENDADDDDSQGDESPLSNDLNPTWQAQRDEAEVGLLPLAEQEEARKARNDKRALSAQLKALTPEERKERLQQLMSNGQAMQQAQDQYLLRQAHQTPEQQIKRAVNYLARKAAAQSH